MSNRVRMSLIRWLIVCAFILVSGHAQAATLTATTCSLIDVQAAVNSAKDGDTVVIPNGSCSWTSGISTSKQIILSGQTKGGVTLTHAAGSGTLLTLKTGNTHNTVVRNLNFAVGHERDRPVSRDRGHRQDAYHSRQLLQCS
jgi:phage tail sheath gpL-like